MDLSWWKQRLTEAEPDLDAHPVVDLHVCTTPHGVLRVCLTDRFRRRCRKGRVWKSPAMCTALKNAEYGFDAKAARSRGGADGIFSVDRNFQPPNAMMKKLYDQFLDRPDPLVPVMENHLGVPSSGWTAVRVVSHHLRLLGFIAAAVDGRQLVLVDFDRD